MKHDDARLEKDSLKILRDALDVLEGGFAKLPSPGTDESYPQSYDDKIDEVLKETALRLRDNFPYFHPLYAGQMLKPPHPVARLAYMLALWINPNNHALDGGRASSAMEKEAVAEIARMVGWNNHLGHLTGGGTMANLEALWIAGRLHPGKVILASDQSHYTHGRMCDVLGLRFETIPSDRSGRMDCAMLEQRLARGDVGTVVATMGTTALGSVDPLPAILDLKKIFPFRIHADAAYGGYFKLSARLSGNTQQSFELLHEADSIVIDPHKHGLQPYGCGCVLFRDPAVGSFYRHDSPYTYFTSGDLHLGEISLECSRPGASAVALWATQRLLPLVKNGDFARSLDRSHSAALKIHEHLRSDKRFIPGPEPELDILVWAVLAGSVSEASERARALFRKAAEKDLHLATAELPLHLFHLPESMKRDRERIVCLRSVLMKPEHEDWAGKIWGIIDKVGG